MKHISHHRQGQGKHNVERWTTFRPGPLKEQRDPERADMFVDPLPFASLNGIDTERAYSRWSDVETTKQQSDTAARTRGKKRGGTRPKFSKEGHNPGY